MARTSRRRRPGAGALPGFTLVEAVVSIVIVGVMLVAGLTTVGASRRGQYLIATRSRGQLLAQELMSEILTQRYEEPDDAPLFGLEAGELQVIRTDWDDVDDYLDWVSSPPRDRDGGAIPYLDDWTRSVAVERVNPANLMETSGVETGVKRITVTVQCGEKVVASMTAIRTAGWPADEDKLKVLFVVTDSTGPTDQELARQALMQSWGFQVTMINASAPQSEMDAAGADAHAAYVSEEINGDDLGTKLRDALIGVVNEEVDLHDDFGFWNDPWWFKNTTAMEVVDNTHYISSPFALGDVTIFSAPEWMTTTWDTGDTGAQVLAERMNSTRPVLIVLETGAALYDGGTAAGRRVQLPWGVDSFDIGSLNENGRTIMKRAIEWAASREQPP